MPLRLNGSTSGYVELAAPAVASNVSLTLPSTAGNVVVNGANSAIVSGTAQASTSGTSIDFTGIPSWVKRVTVMFNGVSTNGSSNVQVQIGAGTFSTSGYSGISVLTGNSSVNAAYSGSGFLFTDNGQSTTNVGYGHLVLETPGSNNWIGVGQLGYVTRSIITWSNGSIALSGTLDRVRITTVNGTDTFDAGSINILWE